MDLAGKPAGLGTGGAFIVRLSDLTSNREGSPSEATGLTPLDEERARSMADEGGASAAAVEANLADART